MLNDSFERRIAELQQQLGVPKKDDNGFDVLPFNVYGWRHHTKEKQWICYKSGRAVAAIRDDQLVKRDMQTINDVLLRKGAVPLPKDAFK